MPDCRFENFDIAVSGQAAPYTVHAVYGGHHAEGELLLDRTAGDWAQRLARLRAPWQPPGRTFLEATGAQLFAALWRDQVRDLWLRAQADREGAQVGGLRVRLSLSPPDVAALPWEALYDPDRGALLAASSAVTLVRVANLLRYVGAPRPLATRLPLRILAALPEDPTGQVDAAAEAARLQAALAPLAGGGVHLSLLRGRFGVWELRRRLEQERPDVLHVITHGRPDGVLLWQDDEPQLAPVGALRVALEAATTLRLLLLVACSTGEAVNPSPLASLGAQLLQTGVGAVIAMQFDIAAAAAAEFGEQFYRQLVAGRCAGQVDVAANYARSALYVRDGESFAYGTPVLWLNASDGRIFTPDRPFVLRAPAAPAAAPASAPALTSEEMATLFAEIAEYEAWLAGAVQFERTAIPSALRSIETRRLEHLQNVRDLLTMVAAEVGPGARARSFAQRRAALREQRDHAERLGAFLLANTGGRAAT
jgi:hypothetical protein